MKKIILSAALACIAAGAVAQDVVRMGTEGSYPPYNFIGDDGNLAGFEIDLGNEMCSRAGLTCEWVVNDWDSIIPNLASGNYDTIIAGMSITDERMQVISFTQDYYPPTDSAFVGLSESADVTSVVSAQAATIQAGYVAETGATLLEFATPEETISAVRSGEADAVFADYDYLKPVVDASNGELVFVGDRVPLGGGVGMGLRQSDDELRATFDSVITEMKADGSLNALLRQWFGEDTQVYE
jgi:polar amino acid transport system substrate-binding protein